MTSIIAEATTTTKTINLGGYPQYVTANAFYDKFQCQYYVIIDLDCCNSVSNTNYIIWVGMSNTFSVMNCCQWWQMHLTPFPRSFRSHIYINKKQILLFLHHLKYIYSVVPAKEQSAARKIFSLVVRLFICSSAFFIWCYLQKYSYLWFCNKLGE